MGVVLNDEVKSIAYIKSQISDQGEISGRFTKQSADDLALTLRSGALPRQLNTGRTHSRTEPGAGFDYCGCERLVGLLLVVLFMLLYYRGAGVNAVVALILNMILMLAALIIFRRP
jgi:preprotein translocase subunit SecD